MVLLTWSKSNMIIVIIQVHHIIWIIEEIFI